MKDRFLPGEDETLDSLSCGNLSILQKKKGYRYSLDAYLLGAFVEETPGTAGIEIGSGSGVVSILLAAMKGLIMAGVEIQQDLAEMSMRSVEKAGLQDRVTITCCDIRDFTRPKADVIVVNPPYRPLKAGRINPVSQKAIARHEISLDLDTLLKRSHDLLNPSGRFYIVYPSWRLPDLFASMRARMIEPKRMRCVYTAVNRPSEICLVCGIHGGGKELSLESPLIIFNEDGSYHRTMEAVFQGLSFTKKALT
jgi:tRNA1Val (adenine37-N6)-methyltransferase